MINALGKTETMIGRAHEDSAQYIRHLPVVGRVLSPSIEAIVALRPDLVIAWADAAEVIGRLRKSGIATYAARFDRLDASATNMRRIGILVGARAQADSLAQRMASEWADLRRRYDGAAAPTVLYVLDTQPLWTAGPDTFVDDLIQVAGGRNAFDDLPTKWSEVSLEAVISRQPDVIIIAQPASGSRSMDWLTGPGWRDLNAVRNKRVHVVDSDRFNRPGSNAAATASSLARLLHPEH